MQAVRYKKLCPRMCRSGLGCFLECVWRRDGGFSVTRRGLVFFLCKNIESREAGLRVLISPTLLYIVINGQNGMDK